MPKFNAPTNPESSFPATEVSSSVPMPPVDATTGQPELHIAEVVENPAADPAELPQVTYDAVLDTRDAEFDSLVRGIDDVPTHQIADLAQPMHLQMTDVERQMHEEQLVPVIARVTQSRIRIGKQWFNLRKGQEVFVTRAQAAWFREKDLV